MNQGINQCDREDLESIALLHLNKQLTILSQSNPFYRDKIFASGLRLPIVDLQAYLRQFPFTNKTEIERDQQKYPPYGSNFTYPVARYCRYSQTSGSTGKPLRWLDTEESWQWMVENWKRVFAAADVTAKDSVFFAFSFGPFLGFWVAFDAARQIGCLCIPGGAMNSVARLHSLIENKASVLCCTPTYALHLANVAHAQNIDLSKASVRAIIAAGEPGASIPASRARLQELWPGARIYDHHGMTEIGPASYECPKRPGVLHIIEPEFIAEVIAQESGEPVGHGGTGELVLTNLGRVASPLLRYRTGDIVKLAEKEVCECGSSEMALEGGILGRCDDMVQIRGVNVYPGAVEQIIRAFPEIIEYQVEVFQQSDMNEMAIRVEPTPDHVDEKLSHRIEQAFKLNLSLRIPIEIVAPNTLPRFEMKAKRWVKK